MTKEYRACIHCRLHVSLLRRGDPCAGCGTMTTTQLFPPATVYFDAAAAGRDYLAGVTGNQSEQSASRRTGWVKDGSRRVASSGRRDDSHDDRDPKQDYFEQLDLR